MMMDQSQMMSMGQPLPVMSNESSQMMMNQVINPSRMTMNQLQSQGMLNNLGGGGGYGRWPPVAHVDQLKFNNQNTKPAGYVPVPFSSKPRNNKNWKVKKVNDKRNNNNNRKEFPVSFSSGSNLTNVGGGAGGYNSSTLKELQQQNRLKARRYFSKKRFNHGGKSAPLAPRNTTSFLIRAKKSGGITSLVSPCPVTPAVLPTPNFSPSREVLVDTAKEEWGVDGYGSMKGLIRLKSPGNEEECGSSESDVEEHLDVEKRLDHDLSRFEMVYPNSGVADHSSYLLENRVDDQDTHIAQLEEENLMLKERLFLMEQEFNNLRTRLQTLEMQRQGSQGYIEEVVENDSEYGSIEENNELSEDKNEDAKKYSNGEKGLQEAALDIEDGIHKVEKKTNGDIEVSKIEDHVNVTVANLVNR